MALDMLSLLAGAAAGAGATKLIPIFFKAIVDSRASERGIRFTAEQEVLNEVAHSRNRSYAELWDMVGFICPPHMIRGLSAPERGISRAQMEELSQGIDRWYRENGALMDATSRYWLLALRERCFHWLYSTRQELFTWNDDQAVQIWLTKTALRISLNRNLLAPSFERIRGKRQAWIAIAREIDTQLVRNYKLVRSVWTAAPGQALRMLDDEEIADLVVGLLAAGRPPGRPARLRSWLRRRTLRRLAKGSPHAPERSLSPGR